MEERTEVVRVLNGLLTTELRAINQYFLDSKLAGHWGFERLAHHFRHDSFEEMRDAEALADRILLLGGLPNFQRMDAFAAGETVPEQLAAAAELESGAISAARRGDPDVREPGRRGHSPDAAHDAPRRGGPARLADDSARPHRDHR